MADSETERVQQQVQVVRAEDPAGLAPRLVDWAMEQACADRVVLLAHYELYCGESTALQSLAAGRDIEQLRPLLLQLVKRLSAN